MSQKYIDFVPSKKPTTKGVVSRVAKPTEAVRVVRSQSVASVKKKTASVSRRTAVKKPVMQSNEKTVADSTFSIKKEPMYGVIEDFHPKFVRTEVEKRPLSRSHFGVPDNELLELKSRKVGRNTLDVLAEKVEDGSNIVDNKKTLAVPKTPFIAKAKVNKRPLSKNVYEKPIQPTKESATGPVTIISKSEPEEGKGGMVIAVILTIILGAVAGTIAFLILPK